MTPRFMLPPTYLLIAVAAMLALHFAVPVVRIVPAPLAPLGFVVIAGGVALSVWAASRFKRAGTPLKPFTESTVLMVDGPFKHTRNPMYLGLALVLVGVWLSLGSLTPVLVIPVLVWRITARFIRPEERRLEERFGQAYVAYKAGVRRWL